MNEIIYIPCISYKNNTEVLGIFKNRIDAIRTIIDYAIYNENLIDNLYHDILNDTKREKYYLIYNTNDFKEKFNKCSNETDFGNTFYNIIKDIFIKNYNLYPLDNAYFNHVISEQKIVKYTNITMC
jgi:hypothetical protein